MLLFLLPLCESSLVVAAGLPLCPRIVLPFASQLLVLLFQSLNLHRSLQEESVGASKGYEIAILADEVSLVTSKLTIARTPGAQCKQSLAGLEQVGAFQSPSKVMPETPYRKRIKAATNLTQPTSKSRSSTTTPNATCYCIKFRLAAGCSAPPGMQRDLRTFCRLRTIFTKTLPAWSRPFFGELFLPPPADEQGGSPTDGRPLRPSF